MISLILACMNREKNLVETLLSWIDSCNEINEIILVDWSSRPELYKNQKILDLINNQKIKLINVIDEHYFSLSKAYNLAYSKTKIDNKYIVKLDSDYRLIDNQIINRITNINDSFLRGPNKSHYTGFFAIEKKNFLYYNENFDGWGYDDIDLYNRLIQKNIRSEIVHHLPKYIYHIPHSDIDSTQNYAIKNKACSQKQNRILATKPFEVSKYETVYKENNYEKVKRIC